MSTFKCLELAQRIVDLLGDSNWFCEHYTRLREHNSIMDSIEIALKEQGLWKVFKQYSA